MNSAAVCLLPFGGCRRVQYPRERHAFMAPAKSAPTAKQLLQDYAKLAPSERKEFWRLLREVPGNPITYFMRLADSQLEAIKDTHKLLDTYKPHLEESRQHRARAERTKGKQRFGERDREIARL